jgi:hypothetical protein
LPGYYSRTRRDFKHATHRSFRCASRDISGVMLEKHGAEITIVSDGYFANITWHLEILQ